MRAYETTKPEDDEPIEWILITTLQIQNLDDAAKVERLYLSRWTIEEYHRVLKNTCNLETLQLKSVDRLEKIITIKSIVSLKLIAQNTLSRIHPDDPIKFVLTPIEELVVENIYKRNNKNKKYKYTVKSANEAIANIGGYVSRKDTHPGQETFSHGMQKLGVVENVFK